LRAKRLAIMRRAARRHLWACMAQGTASAKALG
jgi:hypothetical protein